AVTLNWTQSAGATSYDLYRNGALYTSGLTGLTFYNSVGLVAGQSYTYFVRARNSTGTTDSQTITVSIPANVCATAPGSFTLSNLAPVCDQTPPAGPAVTLNWTQSAGATSYDLYRNGALYTSGLTGLTFYNNVGLVAGQSYTYFVRARDYSGATDSQTITVSIPTNVCGTVPGSFTLSNLTPVRD